MAIHRNSTFPKARSTCLSCAWSRSGPCTATRSRNAFNRFRKKPCRVQQGSLYPALHRLENKDFLAAEWGATETGREAKFYRLTTKGRAQLKSRDRELGPPDGSGRHDSAASTRRECVNWLQRLLRTGRMEAGTGCGTSLSLRIAGSRQDAVRHERSRSAPRDYGSSSVAWNRSSKIAARAAARSG